MALLKLARMGHPVLRQPARSIPAGQMDNPALQRLIDDMALTMVEDEGIGLAAPQVFQSVRLVVLGTSETADTGGTTNSHTVLINPVWLERTGDMVEDWEGCLSLPGLRGLVPRHNLVRLQALDRSGHSVQLEAEGYMARVLQHEIDHLDGILYVDRMPDLRHLAFLDEFRRYWSGTPAGADQRQKTGCSSPESVTGDQDNAQTNSS